MSTVNKIEREIDRELESFPIIFIKTIYGEGKYDWNYAYGFSPTSDENYSFYQMPSSEYSRNDKNLKSKQDINSRLRYGYKLGYKYKNSTVVDTYTLEINLIKERKLK